jgi:DNA-binding transcriptional regulator YiaG
MTNSSLKEKLARLGPSRAVDLNRSGSSVILVMTLSSSLREVRTIDAIFALRRCGVPPLMAKRAIEHLVDEGRAVVIAPLVGDVASLAVDLKAAGVSARPRVPKAVSLRDIRSKLGLSQEEFALRFNLDIDTVQNWEQGRRTPDVAAENYLRVIEADPTAVEQAISNDAAVVA